MKRAFSKNDPVFYRDNDSADTGTVVEVSLNPKEKFPYKVSWDDNSETDWYSEGQLGAA